MSEPRYAPSAATLAAEILADVGEQMGELYAALPDLIHDRCEEYYSMSQAEKEDLVQAVATVIGGEGYIYDYPVA